MPATAERDAAIAKATANAQYQEEQYETKQALRVAQSTIGSLQSRITQKEQTIAKLQVRLSVCASVCPSVRPSVYMSVCLRDAVDVIKISDCVHVL